MPLPVTPARRALDPFLLGTLAGALAALGLRRALRPDPPPLARVGTALDDVNDAFHAFYDRAKQSAALDAPVFLVLADELVLVRRGERRAYSFAPRLFHVIKSAAHAPVALYAALHRLGDGALDASTRERLAALRPKLVGSLGSLDGATEERAALDNLRGPLQASLDLLDGALVRGRVSAAELAAFAKATGPALLRGTDDATRLQLDALDAHVARALDAMGDDERGAFQVVVTGDHQARARSLAMQYFQKLVGEPPGDERRVAYAEGVRDEAEALALVGTRRLDRAVAEAFFDDPKRLQRDVLGDAARERLRTFEPRRRG